jgi:nucleotide-binding universal stress UspA family protein
MSIENSARITAIGVPLDGSRLSEEALPLAMEIARKFQAGISLITVLDTQVDERFAEFCRAEDVLSPRHYVSTRLDSSSSFAPRACWRRDMWLSFLRTRHLAQSGRRPRT